MTKGCPPSEDHRKKLSSANMGKIPWNKGKKDVYSEKTLEKMRMSKLGQGHPQTSESIQKISDERKKLWQNPIYRNEMLNLMNSEEYRRKQTENTKAIWQDPEFREKTIKAIFKGSHKRPTSLEQQMLAIIEKHSLPYRYTGDGSFLIGYKNPDFVNTNSQKVCIEVANIFHHAEDYEQKRKDHFRKWGWECIVFRTDKLDEKEILKKLGELHDKE